MMGNFPLLKEIASEKKKTFISTGMCDLKEIDKVDAIEFIQKYHYSPVMPTINKYFLGFFLNNELKGVLTLGWGTQPRHTFNKMFPSLKEEVFEEREKEEPTTLRSFFPEEEKENVPVFDTVSKTTKKDFGEFKFGE